MVYGLTALGVIHTAISLVALAAGLIALIRDKQITLDNGLGKTCVITTALTALTGFGIFQLGGFGKPHALGVITLLVLVLVLVLVLAAAAAAAVAVAVAVAWVAGRTARFGGWSRVVEVVSYSATFLFHWTTTITETSTRLPLGAPLLPNAEAPELVKATGVLVVLFLIGAALQVRRLRKQR